MNSESGMMAKLFAFFRIAAIRAWLTFCLISFLFAATPVVFQGLSPLQSDDPYLIGFLFGCVGICFSIVFSLAELARSHRYLKDAAFVAACALWCTFVWFSKPTPPPPQQFPDYYDLTPLFLLGCLATAAVEWPLLRFRVPRAISVILSILGVATVVLYLLVAIRITSQNAAVS
jgi:hypothetical protein